MYRRVATKYRVAIDIDQFDIEDLASHPEYDFIDEWVRSDPIRFIEEYLDDPSTDYDTFDELEEDFGHRPEGLTGTDKFEQWFLTEYGPEVLESIKSDILNEATVEGRRMKVWREMTGPPERVPADSWLEHLTSDQAYHLGLFWSYTPEAARAHWGGGGSELKIESSVAIDNIDWKTTLRQHMDPHYHEMEKEIRLFKGTPLQIEDLWLNRENVDIPSEIARKQFVA